ncbi:MAG: translation initiation factor IF-2, partial [Terriglobales bacterium]
APAAPRPRGLTPAPPLHPTVGPAGPRPPSLTIASAGLSAASAPPATPGRRVIVPVAPQRPVYQAPVGAPPVRPSHPAPGKPIYQRPAASTRLGSAPMGRAATPEGRRPMHPTRPGANRPAGPRGGQHHLRREPRVREGRQNAYERPSAPLPSGPLPISREITLSEGITVKDLSERLQVRAKDVIRKLLDRGLMVTVNQPLEGETAITIAREFGAAATVVSFEEEALKTVEETRGAEADGARLTPRAPVVTIMGHVDHGKTSLLDAIRQTNVAAGEAGGITQHIGAYKVEIADRQSPAYGRALVFIDTPGHEAFTRMRARGAKVTDVVVLVVSADDGVMPQTLEAIDHAKSANAPLLVAINKIDKPDAQPDRVKKQLADRGLQPEDWGGNTVMVNVSARAKTNLNHLLEMILLVSDLQEPRANPEAPGQGTVLEAELDRGRGPVARVLVQDGTLRTGDTLVLGSVLGRVRALFDDHGRSLPAAGPSTPVEVLGLEALPEAGDRFTVVNDRLKARQIALYREEKAREAAQARASRMNLEALSQKMGSGAEVKELALIVKADVQGSAEVLVETLNKLSRPKARVRVIHSGVGAVTETDVLLAAAANAVIIGFNVRPERKATELADHEKVEIRQHSVIYELAEEIEKAMAGLLEPVVKETTVGRAEVRQTFRIPKVGAIAGCYVRDGKLARDAAVRVVRDGAVVYTGKIASLRRVKEDVTEVRSGLECGVAVSNYGDIKPGDVLEAFQLERVAATL